MRRTGVTIRDVARLAGVSHQTVSRVINGDERVLPETRQRVQEAIGTLEYRPNAVARSLAEGHTRMLACIAPNLTDYTFANIIEGAEYEARQHGYFLLSTSAAEEKTFGDLIEQLVTSQRVEGLMVINPYIDDRFKHLPVDFPSVFIGSQSQNETVSWVTLDDMRAGQLATQHLVELNHHQIACVTGPIQEDCSRDRRQGFLTALQEAGLNTADALIYEGDWSATSGYQAVMHFTRQNKPFSAIFAHNDRMAIGCIHALRQLGRKVPADVSVIGIDDMPLASYFDPPLTTIRQNSFAIGQEAAHILLEALVQQKTCYQSSRLPVELIVRASTAPHDG